MLLSQVSRYSRYESKLLASQSLAKPPFEGVLLAWVDKSKQTLKLEVTKQYRRDWLGITGKNCNYQIVKY